MILAHLGPKALWDPRDTLAQMELQVILVLQAGKEIQALKVIPDLKGRRAIKEKVTKGPQENPGSQALGVYEASMEQVIQESLVLLESKDPQDILENVVGLVCLGSVMCPCATRATTSETTTARAPASDLKGGTEYHRQRFHSCVQSDFRPQTRNVFSTMTTALGKLSTLRTCDGVGHKRDLDLPSHSSQQNSLLFFLYRFSFFLSLLIFTFSIYTSTRFV